jgi:hypothetical protein
MILKVNNDRKYLYDKDFDISSLTQQHLDLKSQLKKFKKNNKMS